VSPRIDAVIGTAYVGLTIGTCYATPSHRAGGAGGGRAEVDRLRTAEIRNRSAYLSEPVNEGNAAGRLPFVVSAWGTLSALRDDGRRADVQFLSLQTGWPFRLDPYPKVVVASRL
jgi:UDPglucose 6-dehydrogenase